MDVEGLADRGDLHRYGDEHEGDVQLEFRDRRYVIERDYNHYL